MGGDIPQHPHVEGMFGLSDTDVRLDHTISGLALWRI